MASQREPGHIEYGSGRQCSIGFQRLIIVLHGCKLAKGETGETDFCVSPQQVPFTIASLSRRSRLSTAERQGVTVGLSVEHQRGGEPRRIIGVVVEDLITVEELVSQNISEA